MDRVRKILLLLFIILLLLKVFLGYQTITIFKKFPSLSHIEFQAGFIHHTKSNNWVAPPEDEENGENENQQKNVKMDFDRKRHQYTIIVGYFS